MVWFNRRSSMAVKARPSTFDTFVARRSSSFDTISVLPGNLPMESPAVVEDAGVGLSNPAADATQAHCPRRSRGRFFGLKLRLPLFGSKDDDKRTGAGASAPPGVWRHCQTASDMSDDDGVRTQRQAEARARLLASFRAAGSAAGITADGVASQPPAHSVAFPVPLHPRTLNPNAVPHGYARNARSLDAPSPLGPGDHFGSPNRGLKASNLVTVEESQDQASPGRRFKESKERWTERASRQISSVASRFRRRTGQHRKKRERDASKEYVNDECNRRKSVGAMGSDGYDTPGPEGPRCPPDNLFIPSGPPDSVYIPTGDSSQSMSMSMSMDSSSAQMPAVAIDPRTGMAAPVYGNRWSLESGYVLSGPMAIWDPEPTIDEQDEATVDPDGMEGVDFSRALSNGSVCQSEEALKGRASGTVGSVGRDSKLDGEDFWRRRGLDVSGSGKDVPSRQSRAHRAPADWEYEPGHGPCKTPVDGSELGSASAPDRPHKPARMETIAMKIFGAEPHTDTMPWPCHPDERTGSLLPSNVPNDTPELEPTTLRHQMLLPECSQEPSSRNVFTEPESQLPGLHPLRKCTPEMPPPLEDNAMVESLDCWNKFPWGDGRKTAAGSVTQSEYDDVRPALRPSLCLSDEQLVLPASRPESEPIDCEQKAGSVSTESCQGRRNLGVSYSSDGPLYHRSKLYQSGFSSEEESEYGDNDSRYTPSQFVLQFKPKPAHRRWHSDCLQGISAVHENYDDTFRSQTRYSLDHGDRLSAIRSDYSRSYDGYPARPGYSYRSGFSDLILPEFCSFGKRDLGGDKLERERKPRKSWLDELQETADLRRKECTYRIACHRAILQNMKESLQVSKLAFDRIKAGLCPQLTSGVAELRRRWGGHRRVRRRNKLARALEKEEDDIWDDIPLVI